ncbi:LysR family transcriptional regulator [Siccibacter colletis]|jgi:DNA-binding transcriptional LysR family regulator|uniref:LysR family transcriptional regulator n=1 Tax=Siccibacter colletis TaxID=1505757 RepID=UPI0039B73D10
MSEPEVHDDNPFFQHVIAMPELSANSRISLRMLRYFQVLAEELHFGHAAGRLNISQPPLSMQIKELEEIMGCALFERTSRKVVLSATGIALKAEVDRLLSATEQSLNYVRQTGRHAHQRIQIGIIGSALWGALLPRLSAFKQDYPDVVWQLHELSQLQQIDALKSRTIDVGIQRNLTAHTERGIHCQLISHESLQVAVPEQSALSQRKRVTLKSLAHQPFISLSFSHSDFASQLYDYCVSAGFYPHITHQVREPQTALALVSAGMGIALLPESCALIQWPGVTFIPLREAIPADLYALWYGEKQPEIVNHFINTLVTSALC